MPVTTGFRPIDRSHRELHRCMQEISRAVRSRDAADAHGWICLFAEWMGEHFAEEEALMRRGKWSGLAWHAECHRAILGRVQLLQRHVAHAGVTHELAAFSLAHLPEMLRFHEMAADFGFAMFARGLASDPGRRLAVRPMRG